MTFNELSKTFIAQTGSRISAGSFETETETYLFSIETAGPATLNHPLNTLHYCQATGRTTINGENI